MEVSLEAYFLTNLLMDVLALGVVARILGCVRPRRLALAGLGGALYAVLAQLPGLSLMKSLPAQAAAALLLARLALPRRQSALAGAGALFAGMLFLGGWQLFFGRQRLVPAPAALLAGAGAGAAVLALLGAARRRRLFTWEVQVYAATGHGEVRFTALVDTGNRLHEPLSGLPVLIAEEALLRSLLPAGFSAADAARNGGAGLRRVAYGALGGTGKLACFRPQTLLIDAGGGWQPAPDVWIALCPGRLPGSVRALAPPALGCVPPRPSRPGAAIKL